MLKAPSLGVTGRPGGSGCVGAQAAAGSGAVVPRGAGYCPWGHHPPRIRKINGQGMMNNEV